MKSKYFVLVSAVMLAAAMSPAVAGDYGKHKERQYEKYREKYRGGHHGKGSFIRRYDQNDDDQVTADEFEQARQARYDLTDENGDGLVDVDRSTPIAWTRKSKRCGRKN